MFGAYQIDPRSRPLLMRVLEEEAESLNSTPGTRLMDEQLIYKKHGIVISFLNLDQMV